MGQPKQTSIIILLALFSLSALLVHARSEPRISNKSQPLSSVLEHIPGWKLLAPVKLSEEIVVSLNLDDFTNAVYVQGANRVSLYIGYYLSSRKVGAAHDPMVCFPGQGWEITDKDTLNVSLPGHQDLNVSTMIAEVGSHRELVFYWFQAYDATYAGTFGQKLALLWKRLLGRGQDNAFVRVTTTLGEETAAHQKEILTSFISSFYPLLIDYVHDGNEASQCP